jgi:hypothetical protein
MVENKPKKVLLAARAGRGDPVRPNAGLRLNCYFLSWTSAWRRVHNKTMSYGKFPCSFLVLVHDSVSGTLGGQ